jgi:hypothetical protein
MRANVSSTVFFNWAGGMYLLHFVRPKSQPHRKQLILSLQTCRHFEDLQHLFLVQKPVLVRVIHLKHKSQLLLLSPFKAKEVSFQKREKQSESSPDDMIAIAVRNSWIETRPSWSSSNAFQFLHTRKHSAKPSTWQANKTCSISNSLVIPRFFSPSLNLYRLTYPSPSLKRKNVCFNFSVCSGDRETWQRKTWADKRTKHSTNQPAGSFAEDDDHDQCVAVATKLRSNLGWKEKQELLELDFAETKSSTITMKQQPILTKSDAETLEKFLLGELWKSKVAEPLTMIVTKKKQRRTKFNPWVLSSESCGGRRFRCGDEVGDRSKGTFFKKQKTQLEKFHLFPILLHLRWNLLIDSSNPPLKKPVVKNNEHNHKQNGTWSWSMRTTVLFLADNSARLSAALQSNTTWSPSNNNTINHQNHSSKSKREDRFFTRVFELKNETLVILGLQLVEQLLKRNRFFHLHNSNVVARSFSWKQNQ